MTPTIQYLAENFAKFNVQYFNGTLRTPKFETFKSKSLFGQFCPNYGNYKIRISIYYDREEKNILNTLLHEMIHQYIRQNNIVDTRKHHGKVFYSIAARINKEGGWHISRCSNDGECPINESVVQKTDTTYYLAAFYLEREGRYFVISMNKDYLAAFKRKFYFNKAYFSKAFFFMSNDSKFATYGKCRTRIVGSYITEDEYNAYKSTTHILCEGEELYTAKINDTFSAITSF